MALFQSLLEERQRRLNGGMTKPTTKTTFTPIGGSLPGFGGSLPGHGLPTTHGLDLGGGGGIQIPGTGGLGGISIGDALAGWDWLKGQFGGGGSEPAQGTPLVPGNTGANCPSGYREVLGKCVRLTAALPGGDPFITSPGGAAGQPTLGMHGVAMTPVAEQRVVRRCIPGMVLGNDGLCYNRSQIRKSQRAHPPGRKPLMTGGDLNAISRAARVARKMDRKKKELERLGLLKKPTRRKC